MDIQKSATNAQLKYDAIINVLADANNQFVVYPNPTKGKIIIDYYLSIDEQVQLSIYNLMGEKITNNNYGIIQKGLHRMNYDLGSLKGGCYLLEFMLNGEKHIKKIIVVN